MLQSQILESSMKFRCTFEKENVRNEFATRIYLRKTHIIYVATSFGIENKIIEAQENSFSIIEKIKIKLLTFNSTETKKKNENERPMLALDFNNLRINGQQ